MAVESSPPARSGPASVDVSEEAARIARDGTILRVRVDPGVGDPVRTAICLEPARYVTGAARVPDDLPAVAVPARAWCRRALAGDPAAFTLLFAPVDDVELRTPPGAELLAGSDRFLSRLAGERTLDSVQWHRTGMTGEPGARTHRPEPVADHGYDAEHAMHALRLGVQGVELLGTGRITLPVPEPWLTYLRAVRRGEVELPEVVAAIDEVAAELIRLTASSAVPDRPDAGWVDAWLHRAHLQFWADGSGVSTRP